MEKEFNDMRDVFKVLPTTQEEKEYMIVIGKHLATTEKFPTREAAEEKINSVDWNLIAAMIYACKEADEYEKKLKRSAKKATKGDLKDQHRKLHDSGIGAYFHHIEVMSDKAELDYEKMLGRLDCKAEDFLMIGNSLKSDVLPVLNIGGHAIHIPYHTTWEYEKIDFEIEHNNFKSFTNITEILPLLK